MPKSEGASRGKQSSVTGTAAGEAEILKRKEKEMLKEAVDIADRLAKLVEEAKTPYDPRIDEPLFKDQTRSKMILRPRGYSIRENRANPMPKRTMSTPIRGQR